MLGCRTLGVLMAAVVFLAVTYCAGLYHGHSYHRVSVTEAATSVSSVISPKHVNNGYLQLVQTTDSLVYVNVVCNHTIIIIPSPVPWLDRRSNVRLGFEKTYKNLPSEVRPQFCHFFVIGTRQHPENVSYPESALDPVRKEAAKFGDILFLDVGDLDHDAGTRSAATYKVNQAIIWAARNYQFRFLVKAGDDTFFRVQQFYRLATSLPDSRFYMGTFLFGSAVAQPSIRDLLGVPVYPPYAQGMGFVITYDLAHFIAQSTIGWRTMYPEDAMVAAWFYGLDIERRNVPNLFHINRGCHPASLLIDKVTPEQWKAIDDHGNLVC